MAFQVSAQSNQYREVSYHSQRIQIALNDVDLIELVQNNMQKVTIQMSNYAENPTDLSIKETEEYIFITSTSTPQLQQQQTNKFCAEQPFFPSYIISIPKGAKIEIQYNNGNFIAKNIEGRLDLKMNTGTINIDNCKGWVTAAFFSGAVNAFIKNTHLDIEIHQGKISTSIQSKKLEQTSTLLKGVYGKSLNKLKVRAIQANINVRPIKTQ